MTVRELLAVFGDCDPDAEVKVFDWDRLKRDDVEDIVLSEEGEYVINGDGGVKSATSVWPREED